MSFRHKIVLQTNAPFLKTGLAENGRTLFNWLAKRNKYDLFYYCTQTPDNDPNLNRMPYRCHGAVPTNPLEQQKIMQSPDAGLLQRHVAYGAHYIDHIIKTEKPTIWLGADDVWSYFPDLYCKKEWFKRINSILHITVDSVPVSPMAYEQAELTKHYFTWANFAAKEMRRQSPKCQHVDSIYGASDTSKFRPITAEQRANLRKQMGLNPSDTIFIYLGRNQLRKELCSILEAFALFKKDNPSVSAKLFFHTQWSDGNGWDIARIRDYLKIPKEDVLCTMFCRNCGRWEVKPFDGEDKDCRFCGAQKAQVSVNGWNQGVDNDELFMIYGLADAGISAHTSGGLEYHCVQTLLSGLPLGCTNYSSGEDFCEQPFVFPIKWHSRYEVQSSFRKATNDINSIKGFMERIARMSQRDREEIGEKSRDWSAREFHIDTIGTKWEKVFDAMTPPDWSSIEVKYAPKNESAPMPQIQDNNEWVHALYRTILNVEPDPDGLKYWLATLDKQVPRDSIYQFFIGEARKDNAKNAAPQDFSTLFDSDGRKKILFVVPQSGGDIFVCTALFEGLKNLYPDADLYVGTEPRFHELLQGCPHVHKILPYHPAMDNELVMRQYVDYFYAPTIPTQVRLNYLTHEKIGLELDVEKIAGGVK